MKFARRFQTPAAFAALMLLGAIPAASESNDSPEGPQEVLNRFKKQSPHNPGPIPLVAFFPPPAPLYGAPINEAAAVSQYNGRSLEPPADLGKYVSEFFYPPLSTWLFLHKLDAKLALRLENYMAVQRELLNELQNVLVSLQTADAETRERELRAFAVLQTPRLVEHEREADQLRAKLILDGAFGSRNVDWSKDRTWRLGDPRTPSSPFASSAELQVLRATAYYQKELLPEQRGLLCELVIAEAVRPFTQRSRPNRADEASVLFFSPETARLRLPTLPPELGLKIDAYTRVKDALKAELRLAVVQHDRSSESKRAEVFRQLAEQQWPRLASLAEQADDIRRDLVALPAPPPPPLPPQIPAELAGRIEACKSATAELANERMARVRAAADRRMTSTLTATNKNLPDLFRERMAERFRAQRQAEDEFAAENADRYDALAKSLALLSADLLEFAQAHVDPVTGDRMDVKILLARVKTADRYFEQIAREEVLYKNYRVSMLELGLSPEQRRLLMGMARVELAQPLPGGEPLPTHFISPML